MKWPRRWRAAPAHWKEPTEEQREQWKQLLERYAESDDPEQNMVVDIINYFSHHAEGRRRAGITLLDDITSIGRKRRESGREGGKHTPFSEVHDLAAKLWREDRKKPKGQREYLYKKDCARYVVWQANESPGDFGLVLGDDEVDLETIYRELCDRTKGR